MPINDTPLSNCSRPTLYVRPINLRILCAMLTTAAGLAACESDSGSASTRWRESVASIDANQPIEMQFSSIAGSAISHGVVEGVQYALVDDGKTLAVGAFGVADRESRRPMTVDTAINVASISKAFTAWGFVHWAERADWDLDRSIRELLTGDDLYTDLFSDFDVSARQLLSHTSGLSGPSVPVTPATQPLPALADILRGKSSVGKPEMEAPPGRRFAYSGLGYLVLQKVIEQQTGDSFSAFMADAVLTPAQMDGSLLQLDRETIDRVAVYYRSDGRRREPYHLPGAAGGLYSTARDMARFIILYTDAGADGRARIVSEPGFSDLLEPVAVTNGAAGAAATIRYALGHYTYDTPEGVKIAFHAGGNPGLRSLFVVAPELDAGFFVVANNDRGSELLSLFLESWGRHHGITVHEHF